MLMYEFTASQGFRFIATKIASGSNSNWYGMRTTLSAVLSISLLQPAYVAALAFSDLSLAYMVGFPTRFAGMMESPPDIVSLIRA